MHTFYRFSFTGFVLVWLLAGSSCSHRHMATQVNYSLYTDTPDYSKLFYWAAHPGKRDPSDSVPSPFGIQTNTTTEADVFFIHPTTFTSDTALSWNASLLDSLLNIKTDYSSILYQASAFNAGTRLFAPRYRQAHYRSFFSSDPQAAAALEKAYQDTEQAFKWYLEHYHTGRPLIIAAHSQGTVHAARLIRKYFDDTSSGSLLVAAYLIGMPVPVDYFSNLKPCTSPEQNGCIISWRSYKTGYTDTAFVGKERFRAIVTNPLSWDTGSRYIPRQQNTGGILRNYNRLVRGVVSAQVHGNVLWTSKPRFFGNFLLRQKNYHIGDINLFYASIRQNVQDRINHWYRTRQSPN